MATLLGTVLLAEALAITAAGVSSRLELVDTEPNMSAGLLSGGALGAVGLAMGAAIGGALTSAGSLLWLVGAVVAGVGLFLLAILPREDLGSTLPTAIVVGALGLTIVTGTIGVGWRGPADPLRWLHRRRGHPRVPSGRDAPVGLVGRQVPGRIRRSGPGVRGLPRHQPQRLPDGGRMATIVVFVTVKGVGYAFHGLSVGALTALVLLTPALLAAVQFARHLRARILEQRRSTASPQSSDWRRRRVRRALRASSAGSPRTLLRCLHCRSTDRDRHSIRHSR